MKHCRKQERTLTTRHYTHCADLPADWDNFVPAHHFLHSSHLLATERAHLPDISFLYIQVLQNDQPVLVAGFQVLNMKGKHMNPQKVKPIQQAGWLAYTTLFRPRLLVSGHLFRHDVSSLYCSTTADDYNSYLYYKQAIETALQLSCASAVLIKDMPEKLAQYFQNYEPGYLLLRNDISMEMSIPIAWRSIQDYEQAMKHKYAQRFRKIRQPWEALTVKELDLATVKQRKQELFELYRQVSDNQQVRIGILSPDFIPLLKQHDDRLKVWGIFEEEELIGFFSAWTYEQVFDMFYIGFDYNKNQEYNLYFNILYFSIEQAITFKKSKLILGRTALDAKARLGCKPRYLSTFIYIRNNFIRQRVMRLQSNTQGKEGAWEAKHPFKKQTGQ